MAEAKKLVSPIGVASDPFSTDRATWRYVTIPKEDVLGEAHPGVAINKNSFGPGKHFVPGEIADEIERLLKGFDAATLRVLQPRSDKAAEARTGFQNVAAQMNES